MSVARFCGLESLTEKEGGSWQREHSVAFVCFLVMDVMWPDRYLSFPATINCIS